MFDARVVDTRDNRGRDGGWRAPAALRFRQHALYSMLSGWQWSGRLGWFRRSGSGQRRLQAPLRPRGVQGFPEASQKLVLFDERLSANELAVPGNRDQSDRRNAAKFWCVTYRNENEVRTTTDSTVKGSHLDNGVSNGV